MDGMGEDMVDDVEEELCSLFPPQPIFYVFTNKIGMEGAACILYKNCLAEFALKQGCDITILPSSVHETLLMPDRGDLDYEQVKDMVGMINESDVPDEDVLSDRIYRYSLSSGEIELV